MKLEEKLENLSKTRLDGIVAEQGSEGYIAAQQLLNIQTPAFKTKVKILTDELTPFMKELDEAELNLKLAQDNNFSTTQVAQAQKEVYAYLQAENDIIKSGREPTHEMTMKWLEACAERWANDPKVFAERRGFKLLDEDSLTNRIKITYAAE